MEMEILVNTSRLLPFTEQVDGDKWGKQNPDNVSGQHSFVLPIAMTVPEALGIIFTLSIITMVTIVGNVLVILSVFTYKPLRIVQNFFIVSLAVADLTVAILVMPLNVVYTILGRWIFGLPLCEMWLTCDVLCCTASILNLCAIALDRFWAITDPLDYAQKRTFKRVMLMIVLVWLISGIICLPPLIGWNDWPDDFDETNPCRLTEEKGYIIYSSCGSFYIPLLVMTLVYIKIFWATRRRLRERARASKIAVAQNLSKPKPLERTSSCTPSEANHNEGDCADVMRKENGGQCSAEDSGSGKECGEDDILATDDVAKDVEVGDGNPEAKCLMSKTKKDGKSCKKGGHHEETKRTARKGTTANPTTGAASIPQFIEERQKISLSKERRAARILGIIMGVFVVCWLPFFLMYVILPFCEHCYISPAMINFITWLGYINSALNPVIYTIFNMDFRKAFAKLLKCK